MSGLSTDDIIRMAREAGWGFSNSRDSDFVKAQLKFAELVAAAEREACAKLCDIEVYDDPYDTGSKASKYLAAAIRARGKDAA
jgi:hypothetical protein